MKRLFSYLGCVLFLLVLLIMAGCHEEDFPYFHFITPEPGDVVALATVTPEVPEPTVEPQVVPEEEDGVSEPEPPTQPPCLDIKGNIDTRTGAKIYYLPDADYYSRVKINEAKGERWFCNEQEAIDAGWQKSSR